MCVWVGCMLTMLAYYNKKLWLTVLMNSGLDRHLEVWECLYKNSHLDTGNRTQNVLYGCMYSLTSLI